LGLPLVSLWLKEFHLNGCLVQHLITLVVRGPASTKCAHQVHLLQITLLRLRLLRWLAHLLLMCWLLLRLLHLLGKVVLEE